MIYEILFVGEMLGCSTKKGGFSVRRAYRTWRYYAMVYCRSLKNYGKQLLYQSTIYTKVFRPVSESGRHERNALHATGVINLLCSFFSMRK